MPSSAQARLAIAALALIALAWTSTRVLAIGADGFHWDEFGQLRVAARTAETGMLMAGGRPGLVTLVLLPFVQGCIDEIATLRAARWLWLLFTLGALAGLFALVRSARPADAFRSRDAALAVGLAALLPAFLWSSVQIRTDHLAVLCGLWGGVALLASRREPRFALLAGAAFGLGFLASQKLLYVGALVAWIALADTMRRRAEDTNEDGGRARREGLRVVLCIAAGGAVIALFYALGSTFFESNRPLTAGTVGLTLGDHLGMFDFYRQTMGFSQYAQVLPTLAPHGAVTCLLALTTVLRVRAGQPIGWLLGAAWGCLALGLAVAFFHASAFLYFWIVLSLFPAAAAGLALGEIRETLSAWAPRIVAAVPVLLWTMLVMPAIPAVALQLGGSQGGQRESLAFVHRNFAPTDAGFQPEGVLFCGGPERDFGIYYGYQLYTSFGTDPQKRERNIARMRKRFEQAQVKFLLGSWRLRQFPDELREFWVEHYQPYKDSVYVAGRRFEPRAGETRSFDLLVEGRYRWFAPPGSQPVEIDGQRVGAGETIRLAAGTHALRFAESQQQAFLLLALAEPPGEAMRPFYERYR